MNIKSTAIKLRTHAVPPKTTETSEKNPDVKNEASSFHVKDVVTKAAFATGGALGGTGLGVVTGLALSNVSGAPLFGQVGGAVGAIGGAVAGLSLSNAEVSKEGLSRSIGSWAGASVGSSAGMYVTTKFGNY